MQVTATADWSGLRDHADAIGAPNRHRQGRPIALTWPATRNRQVLSPETLNEVQFAAVAAAWLDAQLVNPGNDPSRRRI